MKRIALAVALVVMGGCAGMTIVPLYVSPPTGLYNVVGVRSNNVGFQSRLLDALRGSKAFAEVEVLEPESAPLPDSGLRVSSYVWEVETGGGYDFVLGGRETVRRYVNVTVELRDSKARRVAKFRIWRFGSLASSYEVGSLADETAAAIVRWSQGRGLSR